MTGKTVLMLDGRYVEAQPDETILEVAERHDVFIPALCHLTGLSAVGACRLCLVKVKGIPRLLSACTTKAADGMEVTTDSPDLRENRRTALELIFSERNHVCSVCVSNGHCELQALAQKLGMDHVEMPYLWPAFGVDSSHDRYRLDHNRCILCSRCVRVCDEIEGARTKQIVDRGIDSVVAHDLNIPWGDSETCTNCEKCVHVCPTGALVVKGTSAGEMQKRKQFLPYLTKMRRADHEHA